jgi:selenocysteine lyase/cysteine desulfurase
MGLASVMEQALARFLARYPEYGSTSALDALRASDFARLDAGRHVYADYTGASLYAESHVRAHADLLAREVFGNPHSGSLSSAASTRLVEATRQRILTYFNASPDTYTAIFTLNASAALKLVGESYPFAPGGRCLLTFDNHNSVNGIREFALARGADVDYAPLTTPDLAVDRARLTELLDTSKDSDDHRLFAFPAQSNFSGVKHALALVGEAEDRGWDVLLDAAAFVPTNRLDLGAIRPAFVALSFYKMFGYPTGVGCLLARRDALARLRRPWFAGGTITFATVQGAARVLAPGEAGFEDGTLNYLSIPAVSLGLEMLDRVGIETIQTRVRCLTAWLLEELLALEHGNGRPMVRIYGPATTATRGGAVTFNLYDPDGHLLDYRRVEELASAERISFRTGCFCNPGAGEAAEHLTEDDITAALEDTPDLTLPRFLTVIQHRGGKSAGAIRVSFGLASTFGDAYRVLRFVAGLRDQTRLTVGEVSFDVASCRVMRDGS